MSGSVVGALRVDLGMETAAFTKGAKHAEETLGKLHEKLKEYAAKFVAAFAFEAIVEGIHGSIEAMDQLGKTAQKVGIPVEELSKLSLAAKLTDTSMETLASTTVKLSKNLELIQGGKGGNAGAAFKAIGVSAVDASGKLKEPQQVIADIVEKFHNMKDGANKTAIALAIFNKTGAEMIPFLNQGKQGLEEAAALQEKFGLTTQAAADQSQNFNDNLTILKAAFQGLFQKIAIEMLPALNDLTNAVVSFVAEGGAAEAIGKSITDVFDRMGQMFRQDAEDLRRFQGYWNFFVNGSPEFQAMVAKSTAKTYSFTDAMAGLVGQTNAAIDAQRRFDGLSVNEKDKGDLHNAQNDAPNFTKIIADEEAAAKARAKALAEWNKLLNENKSVLKQTETPIEKYLDQVKKLDWLLSHHIITSGQYASHLKQLREEFAETVPAVNEFKDALEKTTTDHFRSWLDNAVDGTFNLTTGIGDLIKSITKLSLNNIFTQLMTGNEHPFYGGTGGSSILSGLFKGLLGFADGGTILPGGSGGIDSQVVAFRKSPNERVDITKPGQVVGNGGGNNVNVSVNNYASPDLSITATQNNNNNTLEIAIEKKVNDTISSGRANQSMASGFGLRPMRTRR